MLHKNRGSNGTISIWRVKSSLKGERCLQILEGDLKYHVTFETLSESQKLKIWARDTTPTEHPANSVDLL